MVCGVAMKNSTKYFAFVIGGLFATGFLIRDVPSVETAFLQAITLGFYFLIKAVEEK